jgi:hypothetical protein
LAGFNPLELSATQGAAAGNQANNQAIAGLTNQAGINKAGVATGQAGALSNLASQYYGGLAGNDVAGATAQGNNLSHWQDSGNSTQLNITPQIAGQNTNAANAELAGSGNLWKLGMQAATLAAGGMGGMGLGGGSFGGMGGNLGASGAADPSMWNSTLPKNGFNWG